MLLADFGLSWRPGYEQPQKDETQKVPAKIDNWRGSFHYLAPKMLLNYIVIKIQSNTLRLERAHRAIGSDAHLQFQAVREYYQHNMRRRNDEVPLHVRMRQWQHRKAGMDSMDEERQYRQVHQAPDDNYFNAIEPNFFEKRWLDPLKAEAWSFGVTLLRMVANTRALQRIDFRTLLDAWIQGETRDETGRVAHTEGGSVEAILGHDDMLRVFAKSTYFSPDGSAPGLPRRGVGNAGERIVPPSFASLGLRVTPELMDLLTQLLNPREEQRPYLRQLRDHPFFVRARREVEGAKIIP